MTLVRRDHVPAATTKQPSIRTLRTAAGFRSLRSHHARFDEGQTSPTHRKSRGIPSRGSRGITTHARARACMRMRAPATQSCDSHTTRREAFAIMHECSRGAVCGAQRRAVGAADFRGLVFASARPYSDSSRKCHATRAHSVTVDDVGFGETGKLTDTASMY